MMYVPLSSTIFQFLELVINLPIEIKSLDVFAGDIRDPMALRTAMHGCDVVLHLAALIAIHLFVPLS